MDGGSSVVEEWETTVSANSSAGSTPRRRPVTVRVARWSATHPRPAIAMWVAFVVLCLGIGNAVALNQMDDLDFGTGQSGRAAQMLHDAGLEPADTESVLVTARSGSLDTSTAGAAVEQVRARMAALPEVASVGAPVTSGDGEAMLVTVSLVKDASSGPLLEATSSVQDAFPSLRVEEVGSDSLSDAVNDQVASDLGAAATFSLPVTLLILLVAFGAILAAGVPVLLAVTAVMSATGLSTLASQVIPDSGTTSSMILLMGMAVGVDYSLFYVKRAREERHRGRTHLDSIEIAAETSGHSVLVSGAAVIVSMLGLFLAGQGVFYSLAMGSVIVVAVAVVGSLTVLPAVLAKLGRRIDRPRVPLLWRLAARDRDSRIVSAVLRRVLARPALTLGVSVLALLALALPAIGLKLASDTAASLPRSIPEMHAFDRLTAAFPGEHTTDRIVVRAPAASAPEVSSALSAVGDGLAGDPLFSSGAGDAEVSASADGTVHTIAVDVPFDAESAQARDGLRLLRNSVLPQAFAGVARADWAVGGETASSVDMDHALGQRMPWVVGFVVLMTVLIMGWVFRSVVIALTTAAVNLLSTGAAFGVLVLTFQHTWAEGLLGFTSTGKVINWIPLFTFAVLFGLSMDYHVFVISRIREAAASGLPIREAVRLGILRSAGAVTSAAIIMVSVFAIFASLHMVEMKEIGVGLAVAVLLDALVVRLVVLPSAMALLGRWNWWPGSLGQARDQRDSLPVAGSLPREVVVEGRV